MKINPSQFIKDPVIEKKKKLIECNTNVIPSKAGSEIKITDPEDYKESKLRKYQGFIGKLMYLACWNESRYYFRKLDNLVNTTPVQEKAIFKL